MKSDTTIQPAGNTQKLSFPFKGGVYCFSPDDIIRLKAESNYTFIHIRDHKPILMARVLADYETLLEPFGFIRTHRSHIVNPHHIQFVSCSGEVIMDDQSKAELSRRRKKEILEYLKLRGNAA